LQNSDVIVGHIDCSVVGYPDITLDLTCMFVHASA